MPETTKRLVLCGFGNVGRAFARLVAERRERVREAYGLDPVLAAVVDIGGAAVSPGGALPVDALLAHFEGGGSVETLAGFGRSGVSGVDLIREGVGDVLIETTPANLVDGEPGRSHILAALERGMDVVSANKAPLVLFYEELHALAQARRCGLYISAATAAALPTLDVGRVCLAGARVLAVEGILNGTTNYILTRMHTEGCAYADALQEAQAMGIAETNPRLDVEGLDTRNKILLIANRIFGTRYGLDDVPVTGITGVTPADIDAAAADRQVIKLVGSARVENGAVRMQVEPCRLERDHPLAGIHLSEKGISYLTDTMGRITVTGGKSSPVGAAAALLKDLIHSVAFPL